MEMRQETSISFKYNQELARLRDIQNARDLDIRSFQARLEAMRSELEQNERRISSLTQAKDQKE